MRRRKFARLSREVKTGQVKETAGTGLWRPGRVGTFHSTQEHSLWLGQGLRARKGAGDERAAEMNLRADCKMP